MSVWAVKLGLIFCYLLIQLFVGEIFVTLQYNHTST
jgi:hypothetical protein